jgi:heme exporter protein C
VLGAANLPIIHAAVRWWGGQHPNVIGVGGGGLHHPDMKLALGMGFATFTLLAAALLIVRTRLHLAGIRLAALEQQMVSLDVDELAERHAAKAGAGSVAEGAEAMARGSEPRRIDDEQR